MGKSAKNRKHKRTQSQYCRPIESHKKINCNKTSALDLKSMMCMTITSESSTVNFQNHKSLKELCQQLELNLTSAESALKDCMDIKRYIIKYIPEKLVPSVPCLLKLLPLLLSSPTQPLRRAACDTVMFLVTKVTWPVLSNHTDLLVERLGALLLLPHSDMQQDALQLFEKLLAPELLPTKLISDIMLFYTTFFMTKGLREDPSVSATATIKKHISLCSSATDRPLSDRLARFSRWLASAEQEAISEMDGLRLQLLQVITLLAEREHCQLSLYAPSLLSSLPPLFFSSSGLLRDAVSTLLQLIAAKVEWSPLSKHCSLLVQLWSYALTAPTAAVRLSALELFKKLLLLSTPVSDGLISQLLPVYAALFVKQCTEREAGLSTQNICNEELSERFPQFRISLEVKDDNTEVLNSDIEDTEVKDDNTEVLNSDIEDTVLVTSAETLSLIAGGCANELVLSSVLLSLLLAWSPLVLKSSSQQRHVVSDLLMVFVNKMGWPAVSCHLPLLVQQLGSTLVCAQQPLQCDALRLLSRLLLAPAPLPRHLAAQLLPFLTALLIARGLHKESSLAALDKARQQVFPTATCHTKSDDESSTCHNTFPSRVLQFVTLLSADTTTDGRLPSYTVKFKQQQDLISFITSMCEEYLDKESKESVFSVVVEPLSDERNLQCFASVLLAEQQAVLMFSTSIWSADKFCSATLQICWTVVRTLEVVQRLMQRCDKNVAEEQELCVREMVRPLLQDLLDFCGRSYKYKLFGDHQKRVSLALQDLRVAVESLKFQLQFYDEHPQDLVCYLKSVCDSESSQLSNVSLEVWSHLLVDTLQLIVSTCSRGPSVPHAEIRRYRGKALAEPVVHLYALEHSLASDASEVARDVGFKVLTDLYTTRERWEALADSLMEKVLALYKRKDLPNQVKETLLEVLLMIVHRNDLRLLSMQGVVSWCSTVLEELCNLEPLPACVLRAAVLLASRDRVLLNPYLPDARDRICENVMNHATNLTTAEKKNILKLLFAQ